MHLAYFDENKYSKENPCFIVGGILIPEAKAPKLEDTPTQIQSNFFGKSILSRETEFHGMDLFHGKGSFKGRKLAERVQVFEDIATFMINNTVPVRMVYVNVPAHKQKIRLPRTGI